MPAENGMPENEDVRKKALLRLAVAGVVTAAALGGLWWLDQTGGDQKKRPESAPSPIVAAPQPEVASPETAPSPESALPPDSAQPEQTPVADSPGDSNHPADTPPPPRVSNAPAGLPRTLPTAQAIKQPPHLDATSTARPATPAHPERTPQPSPQVTPSPGKGYVVQLGVFSNPENAHELVTRLQKLGVRAHMEARVQLGPFLNRAEAEKAQSEMRKLGFNALLTLPYAAVPAMK
jgi:DedD protein